MDRENDQNGEKGLKTCNEINGVPNGNFERKESDMVEGSTRVG